MASKITFIGAGNMAGAIIGGLIESGVSPSDITATAPNESELAPAAFVKPCVTAFSSRRRW